MKVAVFGATGLVGGVMLKVLEEMNFPVTELIPIASERSVGKEVIFKGNAYKVVNPQTGLSLKPTLALFSAGGDTSKEWAPKFAEAGCFVVDNSSAWRMDPTKKLVVPEINADELTAEDKIIANPNCSTIQMVLALAPLHARFSIKRIVVSTYQSVSGTGIKALNQMAAERNGEAADMVYPYPIDMNCLPHIDVFTENGYTKEELKMVNETRKILGDNSINVSPTTVRIPVKGGHSEAVNVEFANDFNLEEVRDILSSTEGIIVQDDPANKIYPMPLYAEGKNEVFVGRLRRDISQPNTLNMWIVADNLRKGAATNAVQIALYLLKKGFIKA
jgi:aspartate-semialdehyde dehydrogenase